MIIVGGDDPGARHRLAPRSSQRPHRDHDRRALRPNRTTEAGWPRHRQPDGGAGRGGAPAHQILSAAWRTDRQGQLSRTPPSSARSWSRSTASRPWPTVLDAVVTDGHAAVIRGAPGKFYPRDGSPAFRLLQPQEGPGQRQDRRTDLATRDPQIQPRGRRRHRYAVTWLPTFEDRPRSWVIFDVDRVPVPDHLIDDWVDEPDAAVEHVPGLLPEPFRTATCWWSISSSAAVPGPQRARGRQRVQAQAGVLARPRRCSAPRSSAGWRPRRRPSIRPCSARCS